MCSWILTFSSNQWNSGPQGGSNVTLARPISIVVTYLLEGVQEGALGRSKVVTSTFHICTDQNNSFAMAQLYMGIATIFRRYDLELYNTNYNRDIAVVRDCFIGEVSPMSTGVNVRIKEADPEAVIKP